MKPGRNSEGWSSISHNYWLGIFHFTSLQSWMQCQCGLGEYSSERTRRWKIQLYNIMPQFNFLKIEIIYFTEWLWLTVGLGRESELISDLCKDTGCLQWLIALKILLLFFVCFTSWRMRLIQRVQILLAKFFCWLLSLAKNPNRFTVAAIFQEELPGKYIQCYYCVKNFK